MCESKDVSSFIKLAECVTVRLFRAQNGRFD